MKKIKYALLTTVAILSAVEVSAISSPGGHNGAFIGVGAVGVMNKSSASATASGAGEKKSEKIRGSNATAGATVYVGYGAIAGGVYLGAAINGVVADLSKKGIKRSYSVGADLMLGAPISSSFVFGALGGIETMKFKVKEFNISKSKYAPKFGLFGKAHIAQNMDLDIQATGTFYSSSLSEKVNNTAIKAKFKSNDYRLMIGVSFRFGG